MTASPPCVAIEAYPMQTPSVEQAADILLASWSRYIRNAVNLGLPRKWVTERAREGGIAAGSPRPPSDMPDRDAISDRAVARLGMRHRSILRRAIHLRYEKNYATEHIASVLHCSESEAKATLRRAQRAFYHHRAVVEMEATDSGSPNVQIGLQIVRQ